MTTRSSIACALLLVAAACAPNDGVSGDPPALLSALPRALSAPESAVIAADNQLGFDLLARARAASPGGNVLLSPLSAGMVLGMAVNGAAGATLDSMRIALRLGNTSITDIDAGYRSLLSLLGSLDGSTTFSIANSIWADKTLPVLPAFLDAGRISFNAEVQNLDLRAPASVGTINNWVSAKTNGKIPLIVKAIDPADVMLLINAIYFKGHWRNGFDPSKTNNGEFHTAAGAVQTAPMMSLGGKFTFAFTTDAQVVELPYGNGAFVMTIAIPADGHSINEMMNGLDAAHFAGWVAQLKDGDLDLTMPKFTFDYTHDLNDDLSALGMRLAFDSRAADFSRIATLPAGDRLYISRVTQKTFVDVNEDGTEAAAVTSVGIARTSSKTSVIEVNQPFLFVLRERLSGTIFFVGQVNQIP